MPGGSFRRGPAKPRPRRPAESLIRRRQRREGVMTEQDWLTSEDPAAMLLALTGYVDGEGLEYSRNVVCTDRKLRLFAVALCRQPEAWEWLTDDAACLSCGYEKLRAKSLAQRGHDTIAAVAQALSSHCPDCSGTGLVSRSRRAVEVAERYADWLATVDELNSAYESAHQAWSEYPESNPAGLARYACKPDIIYGIEAITRPNLTHVPPSTVQANLLRDLFGNPWRPAELPRPWSEPMRATMNAGPFRGSGLVSFGMSCLWLNWNDGTVRKIAQLIYDDRAFDRLPLLGDALEDAGCDDVELQAHCREPGQHARGCWVLDLILNKE